MCPRHCTHRYKVEKSHFEHITLLCIGNRVVTAAHIQVLLNTAEKAVHGLVQTDVYPEDRQNFKSLEKLMEDRVLNALKQYVVDSGATTTYLMLCKLITSAYLRMDLKPIERIYKIWHAVYFIELGVDGSYRKKAIRLRKISSRITHTRVLQSTLTQLLS